MVGRVDISRDNQSNIEWKIPICSQPIQNAQKDAIGGTVIQFGLDSEFRILLPEGEFDQLFQLLMTDFTLPCALSTVTPIPGSKVLLELLQQLLSEFIDRAEWKLPSA